jgi:predicted Zn-dependent protease
MVSVFSPVCSGLQLEPPDAILLFRATLRQRTHQIDAALKDLAEVLARNPRNAPGASHPGDRVASTRCLRRCQRRMPSTQKSDKELTWTACLMSVNGVAGKLRESYEQLRIAVNRQPNVQQGVRGWVLTSLAEMAARAGMTEDAQSHFQRALAVDAADNYVLGAYADFLLDQNQPREVTALLRDKTRADPLLLRYALALKLQHSKELQPQVEQLRDRFEASRLRGDRVHIREEARFTLQLLNDPQTAVKLAQENWQVQKEPADLRILLESALAAQDAASTETARAWIKTTGLEDVQLERLLIPLQLN